VSEWRDVVRIGIEGWGLDVRFGPVFVLAFTIAVGMLLVRSRPRRWRAQSVNFGFGAASVTIEPNDAVARAAHQAWIEISTRAGAAGFSENDLIVEVYDSWYELFRLLRRIATELPTHKGLQSSEAQLLLDALVSALNEGLRPHLTLRQAAFREWWGHEQPVRGETPQARQQRYPEYGAVMSEIELAAKNLRQSADALWSLVHERTASRWLKPSSKDHKIQKGS